MCEAACISHSPVCVCTCVCVQCVADVMLCTSDCVVKVFHYLQGERNKLYDVSLCQ